MPPLKDENFSVIKGAKPSHPTLDGKSFQMKQRFIMLEHEIKMLEKLENTPSAQSKTEVRQKSVCLKTSRFKLSCFAQTLLRVQIRESFSGETRNLCPGELTLLSYVGLCNQLASADEVASCGVSPQRWQLVNPY